MPRAPQLRIVANHAVGYDNVDVDAANRRGVLVANTPGVLTGATAELTMALVLDLLRRVERGRPARSLGTPWIWSPTFMLGTGLAGKTLGIVGLGRIGREVARLAEAFGMRVVYASRRASSGDALRAPGARRAARDGRRREPALPADAGDAPSDRCGGAALDAPRRDAGQHDPRSGRRRGSARRTPCSRARSRAPRSTSTSASPRFTRACSSSRTSCWRPTSATATAEAREAMGMLCVEALRAVLLEGRCPENALNPEIWGARV